MGEFQVLRRANYPTEIPPMCFDSPSISKRAFLIYLLRSQSTGNKGVQSIISIA